MTDLTIGPLRPSDPTSTMAKAAAKLDGIATAWPDEAMVERVARAIYERRYTDSPTASMLFGSPMTWDRMVAGIEAGDLMSIIRDECLADARAAIAAIDAPPGT